MRQQVALQAMRLGAPALWVRILAEHLGVDRRLGVELWKKLHPSEAQPLMLGLSRVHDTWASELAVLNLRGMMSTRLLLELCRRLAPETGKPRRGDVVGLEERIMERTGPDGEWR